MRIMAGECVCICVVLRIAFGISLEVVGKTPLEEASFFMSIYYRSVFFSPLCLFFDFCFPASLLFCFLLFCFSLLLLL